MVNKVIIIGNLTRDPELRQLPSGSSVTELGIAVNRKYTSGGEKKEETTFVDVAFWGKQAEVIAQYAKKGRTLYIEGRLTLDTWQDASGDKKSKLKVTGEDFQFLGGKSDETAKAAQAPAQKQPSQPVVQDVDDDIPF
jgi:single-strand DNA-binding protein